MLDEMLDFFKVLLKKYPKAKFKFITQEQAATILTKAKEKNINPRHFDIAPANRKDVPNELSKIDIGIFFIKDKFSKKASSPVKQGEFMSMGIPVITAKNIGDTDFIIKEYKSGLWVENFNEKAYQIVIDKIPDLLSMSFEKIREGAITYFSLNKGVDTYQKIYKELLN
jgi:glycosyltransferase involved in cell wall biosynthesis